MTERCLVLFDADRIKDYVFASGRLREIRGASDQVRKLTDKATLEQNFGAWAPGANQDTGVIYAGGGARAVLINGEQRARDVCRQLEDTFRTGTAGATLSAVSVRIPDGSDETVAEYVAQDEAARMLARRKESRPQAEYLPGGAVRFCTSDRLFPAAGVVREPDNGPTIPVSLATAKKRNRNFSYRTSLTHLRYWEMFEEQLPLKDRTVWRTAINAGQDLGSIGRQSEPSGYVALVYADGDGVGHAMRDIVRAHGFRGYQQFSEALTVAANEATARALFAAYGAHPPPDRRLIPTPASGSARCPLK